MNSSCKTLLARPLQLPTIHYFLNAHCRKTLNGVGVNCTTRQAFDPRFGTICARTGENDSIDLKLLDEWGRTIITATSTNSNEKDEFGVQPRQSNRTNTPSSTVQNIDAIALDGTIKDFIGSARFIHIQLKIFRSHRTSKNIEGNCGHV
jgi:hypothetical protein